ncbi:uncharacterized protein CTRU02_209364 [Colletotrichum truncatum]|uniref:Uncharacterized protein n=1 Tax=Colletotrichum truncatum TaxID=5467 RepID=A0ACC3YS54_COLTU|nr:uncharacterized protein CTRU02_08557 [Colletotrichum truncatum]KAF6789858.1 hypothetical protein CTRU02_08557 [Colletotrichum truncatum]
MIQSIKPLLALAYIGSQSLGQSTNTTSLENCPSAIQNIGGGRTQFNSTGTRPFKLIPNQEDDWYLSYTLTDLRGENMKFGPWVTMQDLSVYLSVPQSFIGTQQGNNTDFCMYLMPGRNDTLTYSGDDASRSCEGVLSDNCIRALRSTPPPAEGDCPRADISAACGFSTVVGRGLHLPTFLILGAPSTTSPTSIFRRDIAPMAVS